MDFSEEKKNYLTKNFKQGKKWKKTSTGVTERGSDVDEVMDGWMDGWNNFYGQNF